MFRLPQNFGYDQNNCLARCLRNSLLSNFMFFSDTFYEYELFRRPLFKFYIEKFVKTIRVHRCFEYIVPNFTFCENIHQTI